MGRRLTSVMLDLLDDVDELLEALQTPFGDAAVEQTRRMVANSLLDLAVELEGESSPSAKVKGELVEVARAMCHCGCNLLRDAEPDNHGWDADRRRLQAESYADWCRRMADYFSELASPPPDDKQPS